MAHETVVFIPELNGKFKNIQNATYHKNNISVLILLCIEFSIINITAVFIYYFLSKFKQIDASERVHFVLSNCYFRS